MSLPRALLLLLAPLLLVACPDEDTAPPEPEVGEPVIDPQASVGEPVTYRGAEGTEAEWEMTVTVEGYECDIEVGEDDGVFDPGQDRFCAVHLQLENTGDEANVSDFVEGSQLLTDDGGTHAANDLATAQYEQDQGREPVPVAPGETAQRSIVFSVPEEAEPTALSLQAAASDEFVVIDLGG
jgi:hypothetical protein